MAVFTPIELADISLIGFLKTSRLVKPAKFGEFMVGLKTLTFSSTPSKMAKNRNMF